LLLLILGVSGFSFWWAYLPLVFYGLLAMISALQFAVQDRSLFLVPILPVWYLLMHLSYGTGLLWGFLNAWFPLKGSADDSSPPVEVLIRKQLSQ
jgi:hypothetical protein